MGSKAKELAKLLSGSGQGGTIAPALVSDQQNTSTGLFSLPAGTSAERPGTSYNGSLRYNTEFNRLEQFTPDGWAAIDTPPTIETLAYAGDDLAADTAGGTVITLTGQNFQDSFTVTVGGTLSATVTYVSSTQVTFVAPAKSSGDYDVVVRNANGLTATLQSGISYSGTPNFSTAAALGEYSSATTIPTITIVASDSDGGAISYTVTSGALPTGLTLNADGTVTGTTPAVTGTETSYFTVEAVDDENQSNTRTFNIVVLRPIYAYPISQSLMFNDDDSQYLSYRMSAGDQKTMTISMWVKRSTLSNGTSQRLFYRSNSDSSNQFGLFFQSDDTLRLFSRVSGTDRGDLRTTAVFRDTSAWYHIVASMDAANTTATLWVNGVDLGDNSVTTFQNVDHQVNADSVIFEIGRRPNQGDQFFDGYLAEVNLIDGQALTPTSFAETYNDVWVPKEYTGSYGTNGFHLESPAYLETHSMSHMSFDGSNDVMTTSSNNDFNLSSRTFTIEGWVRKDINANNKAQLISVGSGGSSVYWTLAIGTANNGIYLGYGGGSWAFSGNYTINGITPPANEWYYFALVGTGSTLRYYVNGAFVGSLAFNAFATQGGTFHFGNYYNNYNNDGSWFQGDIGDFRITKDSALYIGDFHTVPTSSLTAVSGTVLLFNGATTDQTGRHSFSVSGVSSESADTYNYYDGKIEDLSGNGNHWASVAGYKPTLDTPTE